MENRLTWESLLDTENLSNMNSVKDKFSVPNLFVDFPGVCGVVFQSCSINVSCACYSVLNTGDKIKDVTKGDKTNNYSRVKSEAIFEEFGIPVHVNHIEKLHDAFPADPKHS